MDETAPDTSETVFTVCFTNGVSRVLFTADPTDSAIFDVPRLLDSDKKGIKSKNVDRMTSGKVKEQETNGKRWRMLQD